MHLHLTTIYMRITITLIISLFVASLISLKAEAIKNINTPYTISKVRPAHSSNGDFIVASTYEGILLGISYDGAVMWENNVGQGIMNHDVWCEDVTGDNDDEIFAANANGTLYCLDNDGTNKWHFKPSEAPLYSVCVVHKDGVPYVACGGYDTNVYYLSANGGLVETLYSSSYSLNTVFGGADAPIKVHIANALRKVKKADGTEYLMVLGTNNSMQVQGHIYVLEVLGDTIEMGVKINGRKPSGDVRVVDFDGDGNDEILMGSSTHINDAMMVKANPFDLKAEQPNVDISTEKNVVGKPGYRVTQTEVVSLDGVNHYFVLHGSNIILMPASMSLDDAEILQSSHAFNDMCKGASGQIILAGDQSGGSAIHIIDFSDSNWKTAYENFAPVGKIKDIMDYSELMNTRVDAYVKPEWERTPSPVYLMHEDEHNTNSSLYNTPVFLPQPWMPQVQDPEDWNRDTMSNVTYRDKRDGRRQYILTEQEVLDDIFPNFGTNGIAYWGGHGNDPYFYSTTTTKQVIDEAAGRQTVLVYPEFHDEGEDAEYVLNNLFYNLADYGKDKNLHLYIRSKNVFWQTSPYLPEWSRLLSGEFAEVFVPSMEETSDKTMDMSISGRMGMWLSGAVDAWGTRAIHDNASYDRLRQHSDQSLDNHFVRQLILAASSGATYFDNNLKPEIFSKLLASGVIFVPERSDLVSLSPVHLSMMEPDEEYMHEGVEVKWLTRFDADKEANDPFVFSRMNGTWPGALLTEWDFSRYAAGSNERRLTFLPSYSNGMVLITPPQAGASADTDAVRGAMVDKLHPLYKDIMTEFYTDGHHYYSADGTEVYAADEYYTVVEEAIKAGVKHLPLNVEGEVAWVCAQSGENHLRLTMVDGGYINPSDKQAEVIFQTADVKSVKDILSGEEFDLGAGSSVTIDVPCGGYRFLDVELNVQVDVDSAIAGYENYHAKSKRAYCKDTWYGEYTDSSFYRTTEMAYAGEASMCFRDTLSALRNINGDIDTKKMMYFSTFPITQEVLSAGDYLASMQVYLEEGNSMKTFMTEIGKVPTSQMTWDVSDIKRGEWVMLKNKVNVPSDILVSDGKMSRYVWNIPADESNDDFQVMYVDDNQFSTYSYRMDTVDGNLLDHYYYGFEAGTATDVDGLDIPEGSAGNMKFSSLKNDSPKTNYYALRCNVPAGTGDSYSINIGSNSASGQPGNAVLPMDSYDISIAVYMEERAITEFSTILNDNTATAQNEYLDIKWSIPEGIALNQWVTLTKNVSLNMNYDTRITLETAQDKLVDASRDAVLYVDDLAFVSTVSTGVETKKETLGVQIYPNPASGSVNVVTPQVSRVMLYTMSGKLLKAVDSCPAVTSLSIADLSPGLYIVAVESADGRQLVKLLVE